MLELKKKIANAILSSLDKMSDSHGCSCDDIAAMLEYPPDSAMGDLALPCFKFAKPLRRAPAMIATELCSALEIDGIKRAENLNGYLNIYIDPVYLASELLPRIKAEGASYGSPKCGEGKTVVLDYSSPNVAKPFHIGHLGTTVIGHSLKLLHEFAGYKCIGINHLGDWGTQFGKLIVAYRKWGDAARVEEREIDELVALYVRFHEEAEKDPSLNDEARAEFTKLEHNDPENIRLWKWFIEISLREYSKTYSQLGIEFDSYNGESFYTDKMPEQVQVLRDKNLMKLDDGASIVDLEAHGMPPCLILKRDGSTLYPTRDIAAAVYRDRTYNFDKCIYVTSAGQSLHFAQWFKVVELMGYDFASKLVHVPYGTVSINGEKLATRTGNVVLLKDLFAQAVTKVKEIMAEKNTELDNIDEVANAVGVGAIVFNYLSNNRMRDINFMLEDALSFEGNTGPYAQYTYARTCSIASKAKDAGIAYPERFVITEAEESELVKVLARFPEVINSALSDYEPSLITRYILDVCAAFNRFYHNCQIVNAEDAAVASTRVALTDAVNTVLSTALGLICMKKPEKI